MIVNVKKREQVPLSYVSLSYERFKEAKIFCTQVWFLRMIKRLLDEGEYDDFVFYKLIRRNHDIYFCHKSFDINRIFDALENQLIFSGRPENDLEIFKDKTKRLTDDSRNVKYVRKGFKTAKTSLQPKWDRGPEKIEIKPGVFRTYKRLVVKFKRKVRRSED